MLRRILPRRPSRFGAGIAFVVSAVLALTTYAYVPAEAATPTPTAPIGAQPEPAGAFTAPDPVSAQVRARSMGQKIEVLSELTAQTTTWANPDGTFSTQSFGTPIRVADAKSATGWDDIDYTLQKNSDGTISPKVDNVPVVLSGKATAAQAVASGVVSINNSSTSSIGFGWSGSLPEPTLDGATATYTNVAPNLNLVVKLTATGFEQYFVLTAAPTAAEMTLLLPLVSKGLTASQASDGSVTFKNSKKQPVAVIPTAYMWDSRLDTNTGLPVDEVPLKVSAINLSSLGSLTKNAAVGKVDSGTPSGGATGDSTAPAVPSLTLSAPASFFTDPNIRYPVTIDPTANEGDSGDDYVRSGADDTTKYQSYDPDNLEVGYSGTSGIWAYAYLNFSAAGWESQDVTSATLDIWENHSWNCTAQTMDVYPASNLGASVSIANTTYNSGQPSLLSTSVYVAPSFAKGTSCSDAGYEDIGVTSVASFLAGENESTVDFSLRASTTNDLAFKIFNSAENTANKPSLSVTYDRYPSTPTTPTLSPVQTYTGGYNYTSSFTPTFTASAADADGGTTRIHFDVDIDGSGDSVGGCTTGYVTQATNASCTLTTPLATDGEEYYLRAQSYDGTVSSNAWTALVPFVLQADLPPTPTITCPDYASGSWRTIVPGSPETCTVTVASASSGQTQSAYLKTTVDGGTPTTTYPNPGSPGPGGSPWSLTTTVTVPATAGSHTITATSYTDSLLTAETFYSFGFGGASMTAPQNNTKTNDSIQLSSTGPPVLTGGTLPTAILEWRPANASGTLWNTAVNGSGVALSLPVTNNGTSVSVNNYSWSTQSAITDTTTGTTVTLNPRLPALLNVRICFVYTSPASTQCASGAPNVLRVPHAFGDGFPTAAAGAGEVALWTGELELNATDVHVTTPAGDLSVGRTHDSFAGPQDAESQVFGPGWSASFTGDGDGATPDQIVHSTSVDGTITLIDPTLGTQTFREPSGGITSAPAGTYTPVDSATIESGAELVVTGSGSSRVLTYTTIDGTKTTWTLLSTTAPIHWNPVSVAQPGAEGTETYTTDSSGRVTQILAPLPAGVACTPEGPSGLLEPGCNALQITYALSTTATSGTPGNFIGQVSSISYEAYDPSVSAMTVTVVASYLYDTSGHLVSVTKPLTSSTPEVNYTYLTESGNTLVATTSSPGYATTTYNYSDVSGNVELQNVTEGGATSGAPSSIQSSYVYDVSPTASGLPDFSSTTAQTWGETSVPTEGYAVFGADHPVDTDSYSTLISESGWSSSQWEYATLAYTDSNGYEINDAEYGAGEWLRSFNSYDADGNLTGTLDATQIDAAEAADSGTAALANQTVTRYNAAIGTVGTAGYVAPETYVTDTWSAPFWADLSSDGIETLVRTHTHYTYDQSAPDSDVNPATGDPYELPTDVTVGDSTTDSATTDPGVTLPADLDTTSETQYGYNPIDGSSATGTTSGWTLGEPTVKTTVMPGTGNNIVHKTLYDTNGKAIETVAPLSNGSDAGTTQTVTYTAGTNPTISACGNQPQWAGMVCQSRPVAEPSDASTVAPIETTQDTSYNIWLEPLTVVESAGIPAPGVTLPTRTTTMTYLADGRPNVTSLTTANFTGSTSIPSTQAQYNSTTFAQDGTASLSPTGTVTASDTSTTDLWGRTTGYTNSLGETTTTSYVAPGSPGAGQVSTVVTPSGPSTNETSTYTYDGTDADGNVEHRGLATGLTISGVGSFTAAYDANGNLVQQNMPAGLSEAWSYNDQDQAESLTYSGDVTTHSGTSTGSWLSYSRTYDGAGRVATEYTPEGGTDLTRTGYANAYSYDQAGRLANVQAALTDATGTTSCTDREYTFDQQGNRTDLNTATGTSCPTAGSGTDTTDAYDTFSRQLTGADGVGSDEYDAFGRQTTIPAPDAPNAANQAITLSYFDTDSVQSIAQGSITSTFILDPDGRRLTESVTNGSTTTTTTDHYSGGSDSPAYASEVTGSSVTYSSYIPTLSDVTAAVDSSGGATTSSLDFNNFDGSTIATVVLPASVDALGITNFTSTDEYGNATSAPADTGVLNYGWQGAAQRETSSAGLVLMGARLYDPTTARFSSIDSVVGGNVNQYVYPDDPINSEDLTGQSCKGVNKFIHYSAWWGYRDYIYLNSCEATKVENSYADTATWWGFGGTGVGFIPGPEARALAVLAYYVGLQIWVWSQEIKAANARGKGVIIEAYYNWIVGAATGTSGDNLWIFSQ